MSLTFKYGTMAASKSTDLAISHYNFQRSKIKVLAIKPARDTRTDKPIIESRLGVSCPAKIVENIDLDELSKLTDIQVFLVDEIQFFSPQDINNLAILSDNYNKIIIVYGLVNDTNGILFPASKRLFELGAKLHQMKSTCQIDGCTNVATNHLLYENGQIVKNSPQIKIDDGKKYEFASVCRQHFMKNYFEHKK